MNDLEADKKSDKLLRRIPKIHQITPLDLIEWDPETRRKNDLELIQGLEEIRERAKIRNDLEQVGKINLAIEKLKRPVKFYADLSPEEDQRLEETINKLLSSMDENR